MPEQADLDVLAEQEILNAHNRLRGWVAELRKLIEQGAAHFHLTPVLDAIEADLATVHPRTVGDGSLARPAPASPIVTTPTGITGLSAGAESLRPPTPEELEPAPEGNDGGAHAVAEPESGVLVDATPPAEEATPPAA